MSRNNYSLGEQYYQTIKGFGTKKREEFEVELLKPQFSTLWPLCNNLIIHKYRYEIPLEGGKHADLDIYKNELKGLYTVEVEFDTEEECDSFMPPDWFGLEVTEDSRYSNFQLTLNGLPKNK
jgi:CYTH domain-containing protein